MNSMTGFANREMSVPPLGKISLEIRSTNHKFLETVFHLPPGFLSLEDKLKKEIESRIKRGRLTCVMNIRCGSAGNIMINKGLLRNYVAALKKIQRDAHIKDEICLDTLVHLPGVLSLPETEIGKVDAWPQLRVLVRQALEDLAAARHKEGRALHRSFKARAKKLEDILGAVKMRFKKVVQEKAARFKTGEERAAFLKDTDITEEVERLAFHIQSFQKKLIRSGPIGKELDFMAQEMQREANTTGAKSCDARISSQVVQMKSQIEKIREQVQNVE